MNTLVPMIGVVPLLSSKKKKEEEEKEEETTTNNHILNLRIERTRTNDEPRFFVVPETECKGKGRGVKRVKLIKEENRKKK